MDPLRPRRTHLGHVPSAWLRPRRREIVVRLLVTILYGAGILTMSSSLATLDTRLFYAPSDVAGILEGMGEAGRAEYRLVAFVDLGFIIVYSTLLMSWARFLRVRNALPRAVFPVLGFLPGVFDAVETGGVIALLGQFPDVSSTWTLAVAFATPMKWITLLAFSAVLAWGESVRWQNRNDPR